MWQSEVTEYFHSRKRNSNFQPSKRQKVEIEPYNSGARINGTVVASKASGTEKTNSSGVQTKSASKIPESRKQNTRSRIPKLQKESQNIRLDDIWMKSCDTTFHANLNASEDLISTKLGQNKNIRPSAPSSQHARSSLADHNDESSMTGDTVIAVKGARPPLSPSKRQLQQSDAQESGTSAVSDVATEVIDDHGNSHPCTPSKRRTVEHGIAAVATNNKRGRCLVPTNSNNYYATPHKFDFSPYQSNISTPQSSSARKKLVLSNGNVMKSPPMFVFNGSTEISPESPVAIKAKEKSVNDVEKEARDDVVIESSDKAEHDAEETKLAAETASTANTSQTAAETPHKSAAKVVKIGTCRNLEQLKKKLRDLSPRKAKEPVTIADVSPLRDRYT